MGAKKNHRRTLVTASVALLAGCGAGGGAKNAAKSAAVGAVSSGPGAIAVSGLGIGGATSASMTPIGPAGGPLVVATGTGTGTGTATGTGTGTGTTSPSPNPSPTSTPSPTPSRTPTPIPRSTTPPLIAITSPARGSWMSAGPVRVEGAVTAQGAGSSVATVTVNGQLVTLYAGGKFVAVANAVAGLKTIRVEALDNFGNVARANVSVLAGNFASELATTPDAFELRMTQGSFDAFATMVEQHLSPADLEQRVLAENPIIHAKHWYGVEEARIVSLGSHQATVALTPTRAGIHVRVVIPALHAPITYSNVVHLKGTVTATDVIAECIATANVDASGTVRTQIASPTVKLDKFHIALGGVGKVVEPFIQGWVQAKIQVHLVQMMSAKLAPALDAAIAAHQGLRDYRFMGQTLRTDVFPTRVSFDDRGMTIPFSVRGETALTGPNAPLAQNGYVVTGGPIPDLAARTDDVSVSIHDDAINRYAMSAWRNGLLDVRFDQASAIALGYSVPIDTSTLVQAIPSLRGKIAPGLPVAIQVTAKLPPVFRTYAGAQPLAVELGEIVLDVTAGGQPIGSLVCAARAQGTLTVANGRVKLAIAQKPTIDAQLTANPLGVVDSQSAEAFAELVLPQAIQVVANQLRDVNLPVNAALSPRSTTIQEDGVLRDFVTVGATLH